MPKGSRGGTSGGATGGAGGKVKESKSLVSERERYGKEVDEVLGLMRDIKNRYGVDVEDILVSKIQDSRGITLGYYDGKGNVGINEKLFGDPKRMNSLYDQSVKNGWHPPRGKRTGLEAVVAHEVGHRLNFIAGGRSWANLDTSADRIVQKAAKSLGMGNKIKQFRSKISGYAKEGGNAEAVAEAFADVYLNGRGARKESRAVYNQLITEYGLSGTRRK